MTVAVSQWVNPCGGLLWRTLGDGRIEVQGQGMPSWAPSSAQRKYLVQTWQNWKPIFQATAQRYGLPASWLVAIATMESGLWSGNPTQQATIGSFDGSIGIMQPLTLVSSMYGYSSADRADPAKNIDMGSHLIADNAKTKNGQLGGFPVVAAMFNGGSGSGGCNPGNDVFNLKGYHGPGGSWPTAVYASNAIRYQNTAVEVGIGGGAAGVGTLSYLVAGVLLVSAAAIGSGYVRLK